MPRGRQRPILTDEQKKKLTSKLRAKRRQELAIFIHESERMTMPTYSAYKSANVTCYVSSLYREYARCLELGNRYNTSFNLEAGKFPFFFISAKIILIVLLAARRS